MPRPPRKKKPPKESVEDSYIRRLYRSAGCTVVTYSQPRQTKQTPGIPDLQVFDHRTGTWWYHEVKRRSGPEWLKVSHGQTEAQLAFQQMCEEFGIEYLIGAREVALQKLREIGRIQ